MSKQHFDEGSPRKFTLTVFLSFAAIFCFVMLMMQWRGDFKPGENENASVNVTETTESTNEHTENMAADSTAANSSSVSMNSDSTKKMGTDTAKKTSDTVNEK